MSEEISNVGIKKSRSDTTVCVCMGKFMGNTYRCVGEKTSAIGHYLGKAGQAVADATNLTCARIGNLFKTIKSDSRLAKWELKQKEDLSQFGAEIFRVKDKAEPLLQDENVKIALARVQEDQSRIDKIYAQKHAQKRRMQGLALFRRALNGLKSSEPYIRRESLTEFLILRNMAALPYIAQHINDPDEGVRAEAVRVYRELSALISEPNREETTND